MEQFVSYFKTNFCCERNARPDIRNFKYDTIEAKRASCLYFFNQSL